MEFNGNALQGLKVLDLGQVIAGNFCSVLLADFGADVVKIERPKGGDGLRYMGKSVKGTSAISTPHMIDNRSKKCITLNIQDPKGREIFFELLKDADVVVENYAPGVLDKLGMGYADLEKVNPRIVMARISGFGQTGPKSHLYGYDRVGMAYGGITYVTGEPDGAPTRPGLSVADYMSGMFACIGVMFAIYNRDVVGTGKGQMIDIGLYESIFRIMEATVIDYSLFGDIRQRIGNGHPLSVPGNHYLTKDGKWVTIASANDAVFKRLCEAVGNSEFLEDERYNKQQERTKPENKAVIDKYFENWFKAHTEEECKAVLETAVPYSAILSIDQIMKEEHIHARGNIIKTVQDKVGEVTMQGVVPSLSKTPGKVNWAGASLASYNEEIYKGRLGFSDEKMAELKAAGVI